MKIAVISTVWFPISHTDVIVSRWLNPYPTDIEYGWTPTTTIASVYLEQKPSTDIGTAFCAKHAIPIFPDVRGAITLGSNLTAIDAVLLIGEHGDYPKNELGQKLYPRKRLFDEIVAVFRETGRAVPIFNDKHLSYDFNHSRQMIQTASELGFALYAGSSLPHVMRPAVASWPQGETVTEALALFYGDQDEYGFHTIELTQSLIESRHGGESGIAAVRALRRNELMHAFDVGEIPRDLFLDALVALGYPSTDEVMAFVLGRAEEPLAYQFKHHDGLMVTHLRLQNFVTQWVVALRTESGKTRTQAIHLAGGSHFFPNFAYLNAAIQRFFLSGVPPTPLARTHLSTGALESAQRALQSSSAWQETSWLQVSY